MVLITTKPRNSLMNLIDIPFPQTQDSNDEKEMQTDDDCAEVNSDNNISSARDSNDTPQKMITDNETMKEISLPENRMSDTDVQNKPEGCFDNKNQETAFLNKHDMLLECETDVPAKPSDCQDVREVIEEAVMVPLPLEVDSDGQGTDGLEKSGEELVESAGKFQGKP